MDSHAHAVTGGLGNVDRLDAGVGVPDRPHRR